MYELFTDGGCYPNPGPGGWAYIIKDENEVTIDKASGYEEKTTNSRMELIAVIKGLKKIPQKSRVILYSDSLYVVNGINQWRFGWSKYDFKSVANTDMWQAIHRLANNRKVTAVHVKGHSGHAENEECDQMASAAYRNKV